MYFDRLWIESIHSENKMADGFVGNIDQAIVADSFKGIKSEHNFSGVLSFARRKYSKDLTDVDLAVTGIPFDTATTNRPGTRLELQSQQ